MLRHRANRSQRRF